MNEICPLERAAEAYERMLSGKARFRVVLEPSRQSIESQRYESGRTPVSC